MGFLSHRALRISFLHLSLRPLCTTVSGTNTVPEVQLIPFRPLRSPKPRSQMLLSLNLKPGFSNSDVDLALRSQSDAGLALDIFRWTGQQRNYKHNHLTYLTMIKIAITFKQFHIARSLVDEVIAGAVPADVLVFNAMIKLCCVRKSLFTRAFNVYKKMMKTEDALPNLETYAMLLDSILNRFHKLKLNVCYLYLDSVRYLANQMKALGVIPNTFVFNKIIKGYSKCREMDEALSLFREMELYNCKPDMYTYDYIVHGLCEKGWVKQALDFHWEMRGRGYVPRGRTFLVLICSFAMDKMLDEAIEVAFDMLNNSMSPDQLTYKTLLEEMCRDSRGDDAFVILKRFKKKDYFMDEKAYNTLLSGVHFAIRDTLI